VNAHQIVEAVLFASDAPLTADEIARADESLDEDKVQEAIDFLQAEYADAERSFQIMEIAEGYQIITRAEFAPYLERFDNVPRPSRLSGPALETLAILAYRQPLGRVEIEYIRGVGASGVMRTLQERQLIEVVGRAEGLGRPLLYGTTRHFLEHFGFRSLEDLPRPEELPVILRERIPLDRPDEEAEPPKEAPQAELELGEGAQAAEDTDAAEGHGVEGVSGPMEGSPEEQSDDRGDAVAPDAGPEPGVGTRDDSDFVSGEGAEGTAEGTPEETAMVAESGEDDENRAELPDGPVPGSGTPDLN
jgi:segregation and condensation protein B